MFKEKLLEDAVRFYLGQHVLDRLLRDGRKAMELGAERRLMSLLWIDIRGFGEISEHVDWNKLIATLNDYRARVLDCVSRHNGIVDGFVGDSMLAYWDMPPGVNHAALALSCAADLLESTYSFSQSADERKCPSFKADIGIDTGKVDIGNFGAPQRAKYTLMGDPINLANRLIYRCSQFGVQVLATGETVKLAGDAAPATRQVESIRVKGRDEMVELFTLAKTRHI